MNKENGKTEEGRQNGQNEIPRCHEDRHIQQTQQNPWDKIGEDARRAIALGNAVRKVVLARTGNAKLAKAVGEIVEDIYLDLINLDEWMTIDALTKTVTKAGKIAGCPREITIRGPIQRELLDDLRVELLWILGKLPMVTSDIQLCHLIDHLEDAIYGIQYGDVLNIH